MAIHHSHSKPPPGWLPDEESDQILADIQREINLYLTQYFSHRLSFALGRTYYLKCYRSWNRVNDHMNKFLLNPRLNYQTFIFVLEHEINRFSRHSHYRHQLILLRDLVVRGPKLKPGL